MAKSSKKTSPTEAPKKPMNSGLPSEGENIDKIRDILFGSQTRQMEKKLTAMEDMIHKEIVSLRSETKTTLDTLEQFLRKEMQSLSDQLKRKKEDRGESVDNLSEKITDVKKVMEKRFGQLNDKVIKDQRETQEQILAQSKNLLEEMHHKNDTLQNRLDQSVEELSREKTDRLALANLLMEAAMRLKDEFQLPETE